MKKDRKRSKRQTSGVHFLFLLSSRLFIPRQLVFARQAMTKAVRLQEINAFHDRISQKEKEERNRGSFFSNLEELQTPSRTANRPWLA